MSARNKAVTDEEHLQTLKRYMNCTRGLFRHEDTLTTEERFYQLVLKELQSALPQEHWTRRNLFKMLALYFLFKDVCEWETRGGLAFICQNRVRRLSGMWDLGARLSPSAVWGLRP